MISKRVTGAALTAPILMLCACNPSSDSAPGAVSEGEAAALEEAAEMLEERRLPDGALPPIDATLAPEQNAQMPAEAETTEESDAE